MRAGRARPVPRSPSVTLWPHRRDASVTVPGTGRGPTGHVGEGRRGTIGLFLRVPRTGGDQTVASGNGFRPGVNNFSPFRLRCLASAVALSGTSREAGADDR